MHHNGVYLTLCLPVGHTMTVATSSESLSHLFLTAQQSCTEWLTGFTRSCFTA